VTGMPENNSADTPDEILILKLPYSDISRYDTTGLLSGLAKPPKPQEPAMNPIKRFLITTGGVFFLMVGLIGFGSGQNILLGIACSFFGLLVIWTFVALPEMRKKKAALVSADAKNPDVSITFARQNIVMRSPYNEFKKDWSELTGHKKTKKGVHLNFTNGTEAYLPLNAFYEGELKTLTTLLQNKKII
jgi:hypothetical protein